MEIKIIETYDDEKLKWNDEFNEYELTTGAIKELVGNESESEKLLDDFINEKALLFEDLHCDVKSILREIYNIGFQDGKNEMGLKVEKLVDEEMDI